MLVRVFIKRRFREGAARHVFSLIRKIRARAMNRKGYISGETLIDSTDSRKTMVIGTWQSMDDGLSWEQDPRKKELEAQLERFPEAPAEYEVYVYSKYYLSVSGDGS